MFSMQEMPGYDDDDLILQFIEELRRERERSRAIAAADPLAMDGVFQKLPYLNVQRNVEAIRGHLEQAVAGVRPEIKKDFVLCSAAIRDICMLAASLTSYGLEPGDHIHTFSSTLLELASAVQSALPRDSFIDYTSRNPTGERERRFTNLPEEEVFIESLRCGMAALDACLEELMYACYYQLTEKGFAEHCSEAVCHFQIMIDAIVQVKKRITPEVFTHSIRPFFDPFKVDGNLYSAPSGAEMSILNIDLVIWGSDCTDELYITYVQANIMRLPPIYQDIYRLFVGRKSLMTMVRERLKSGQALRVDERKSVQALYALLTKMYSFRMPHYKVAEENVKLRLKETAGREVKGSSGFGIDEVKYVLDQTIACRQLLSQLLNAK